MSTGFELIPLAIGGGAFLIGELRKALEEARSEEEALNSATMAFETQMLDIDLAEEALRISDIPCTRVSTHELRMEIDGRAARLLRHEDGPLQLIAPLALGEAPIVELAVDLDTEYRKLVQGASHRRVIEHARKHGLLIRSETVADDGSITITLDV